MSFWRRIFGSGDGPADGPTPNRPDATTPRAHGEPLPPRDDAPATTDDLERLLREETSGSALVRRLQRARGTAEEGLLLDRVVRRLHDEAGHDDVRVACASLLVERGQRERAERLLAKARSGAALLLRADLAAEQGNLARAVELVERALALDIDHPGARERHARYRRSLGMAAPRPEPSDVTFVKPQEGHPAFRLLREVARGGAGTLYEAEDPQLGRRVACKIFHRRAADSDAIRNEARRTTALAGPGVVRLLDADPDAGYIAYEWLPLGSVRDAIAREEATRLGPPDRWATPIAVALARVHRLGFVHGDVKPANILLAGWDLPLLADFGLTVPIGTAHLAGTPGYVSPERLAGAVASPRDDVHAFGRMLTEVIAASGQGTEAWLRLAAACSGPFDERPRDGDALVEALRRPG